MQIDYTTKLFCIVFFTNYYMISIFLNEQNFCLLLKNTLHVIIVFIN